jgi:hypothetical protein
MEEEEEEENPSDPSRESAVTGWKAYEDYNLDYAKRRRLPSSTDPRCGTGLKSSTPFYLQTVGTSENVNNIPGNYLAAFLNPYDDWTAMLPLAEFAYNSFKQKSTQYHPSLRTWGIA